MKNTNKLLCAIFACVFIFIGITSIVWQFNNPKANNITYWTHFSDAIQFKKLDKFQAD
jgi:hypothetical protein